MGGVGVRVGVRGRHELPLALLGLRRRRRRAEFDEAQTVVSRRPVPMGWRRRLPGDVGAEAVGADAHSEADAEVGARGRGQRAAREAGASRGHLSTAS